MIAISREDKCKSFHDYTRSERGIRAKAVGPIPADFDCGVLWRSLTQPLEASLQDVLAKNRMTKGKIIHPAATPRWFTA